MERPRLKLAPALGLSPAGEMVAIVGGGGKTSLMFALARSLDPGVVLTTTTRIFANQMKLAPVVCAVDPGSTGLVGGVTLHPLAELSLQLKGHDCCLVVGRVEGEKAAGVKPDLPARLLTMPTVHSVIIEADGSRMRPCKAPAEHEPVIPDQASLVVPVAGIDALDGPLSAVAHRPERAAALLGLNLEDSLTPSGLARLLIHPQGGLKSIPETARVSIFLNKLDKPGSLIPARQVAREILRVDRIDRVILGAVGTDRPVYERHRRVMAVVLAAGESKRMGQTKQLMPWGDTSVLGRILETLKDSSVNQILVVSGHEAEAIQAIARAADVPTIFNPDYASGGMLSSLQCAVRRLPESTAAVLVVLADQPFIKRETMDQILEAYWMGSNGIIAPAYRGRRGNPVLIGGEFFDELLNLPQGGAPRLLLRRHPDSVSLVEVSSPTILEDLDTPEQYHSWRPA